MIHCIDLYTQHYEEIEKVGQGKEGVIMRVMRRKDKSEYVAKKLRGDVSELGLLLKLNHPNVIKVNECYQGKNDVILILEYQGDFQKLVQHRLAQNKGGFNIRHIEQWVLQLIMGLCYIHKQNVIHRDLKTQNILLKSDGQLKIADFGVSKQVIGLAETMIGTLHYLAPEVCGGQQYTNKADIWSLGCIIYEICTLKQAFVGDNMLEIITNINNGVLHTPLIGYPKLDKLVDRMLTVNPEDRPNADELLKDSYIAEIMLSVFSQKPVKMIGHVTLLEYKAKNKYLEQMNYIKQLKSQDDSIDAQSLQQSIADCQI